MYYILYTWTHYLYAHTRTQHKETDIHIDTRIQYFKCIGCHSFLEHFLQKSLMISGSFAERDDKLKAS